MADLMTKEARSGVLLAVGGAYGVLDESISPPTTDVLTVENVAFETHLRLCTSSAFPRRKLVVKIILHIVGLDRLKMSILVNLGAVDCVFTAEVRMFVKLAAVVFGPFMVYLA